METVMSSPAPQKKNIFLRCLGAVGNFFKGIGLGILNFFKSIGLGIAHFFKGLYIKFVDGSIGTKLSFLIFGAGNFYHKQFIKGFIFLAIQALFWVFMITSPVVNGTPYGFKALANLALQGSDGKMVYDPVTMEMVLVGKSDSFLMLLFGLTTIAAIILYLVVWCLNISSSYKADQDAKKGVMASTFKQDCGELLDSKFHVLMLTPTCLAALIFTLLPTILMICIAFTSYNLPAMQMDNTTLFHWVGFKNFAEMFNTSSTSRLGSEIANRFFPILGWTLIWAVFATFTCYFGGILLALLINKKGIKGKKIFRTIFILTIAVPQFISLLACRNLFGEWGPINNVISALGGDKVVFLGTENGTQNEIVAKVTVIVINMWLGIPYTMLMTSGILMNIPQDLYEAGTVDGASKSKMFFKITLPYVIFITTPYLIGSFVGNINSFNTIFLLTGGGPTHRPYIGGGTDLLVTWLYKLTIDDKQYNTGAIIGLLTFLITATITLITYRRSKAYNEEDTFQ